MFGNPITNEKKYSVLKLKNISEKITNGNTPHGGDKNYVEKGIIFIRSQNVLRNKIDLSDVVYIYLMLYILMNPQTIQLRIVC